MSLVYMKARKNPNNLDRRQLDTLSSWEYESLSLQGIVFIIFFIRYLLIIVPIKQIDATLKTNSRKPPILE